MTKFKLLEEDTIEVDGIKLYRVELTEDHLLWGKAGTQGGYVQSKENLQEDAWVYESAKVFGRAKVFGSAVVFGSASVYGRAWVFGSASVYGSAKVYGSANVYGSAVVYGSARVSGRAEVFGSARVSGSAKVYGDKWDKSPLQIQGTQHFVCTSSDSILSIGCESHSIDYWKNYFIEIGEENNYSEDEISEYRLYIEIAEKFLELKKKSQS